MTFVNARISENRFWAKPTVKLLLWALLPQRGSRPLLSATPFLKTASELGHVFWKCFRVLSTGSTGDSDGVAVLQPAGVPGVM